MSKFIKPTVGRMLWLIVLNPQAGIPMQMGQPLAAQIAAVHSDSSIAIGFLDGVGQPHHMASVPLVQDGESIPGGDCYCVWTDRQLGQEFVILDKRALLLAAANLPELSGLFSVDESALNSVAKTGEPVKTEAAGAALNETRLDENPTTGGMVPTDALLSADNVIGNDQQTLSAG